MLAIMMVEMMEPKVWQSGKRKVLRRTVVLWVVMSASKTVWTVQQTETS